MIVYISGPMTGYPDFNRPLFRDVKEWLIEQDKLDQQQLERVLSPADISQGETEADTDQPWSFYMRQAVVMLMEADTIVMLPGWIKSKGARREFDLALDLGMEVFLLSTHTVAATGQPVLFNLETS